MDGWLRLAVIVNINDMGAFAILVSFFFNLFFLENMSTQNECYCIQITLHLLVVPVVIEFLNRSDT